MLLNEIFTDKQIEDIIDLLGELNPSTKLYFGCDSIAYKKKNQETGKNEWYAKFATVLIIHMNGKNGCKIFRHIDHDRVYDTNKNKPADRLMKEVYRVAALWTQLSGLVDEYDCEIHLDVNISPKYGSSCVANQAAGFILGVTGSVPKLKPESWAASFGADGIGRGYHTRMN